MRSGSSARRLAPLVLAAVALTAAGCAHDYRPVNSGMMGTASGHGYSTLTCRAPTSLPGSTVQVTLADPGMTGMMGGTARRGEHMMLRVATRIVPVGQVSIVASNLGWRIHELVVLPLANGAHAGERVAGGDGKVDESGSLGEASKACAADEGAGLTPGSVGWTTITLTRGRYELLCNLTNHYANGMYAELLVQ